MWHYHLTDADIHELCLRARSTVTDKPVVLWLRRLSGSIYTASDAAEFRQDIDRDADFVTVSEKRAP